MYQFSDIYDTDTNILLSENLILVLVLVSVLGKMDIGIGQISVKKLGNVQTICRYWLFN